MKAARSSMAEIQPGKIATERAASPEVKQFGEMMVTDHNKATEDLKAAASQSGVTLPTDVDPKHRSAINRLSKLSGEAFDRAYMQLMIAEHKKDVAEFQRQAQAGSDENLKQFAQDKLPALQQHLQQAQEIAGRTGTQSADRARSPQQQNEKSKQHPDQQ
jgi:putative membrane protein